MAGEERPIAIILAGPNGAGKSTCSAELLPKVLPFLNADNIAQKLSGRRSTAGDIRTGRVLLGQIDELAQKRSDFAVETTLSARSLIARVRDWNDAGYDVHLVFFYLPSADLAVQRVKERVRDGGHDVPEETIRRRFKGGLRNLAGGFLDAVAHWHVYDNSSSKGPRLMARGSAGNRQVVDEETWATLLNEARDQ